MQNSTWLSGFSITVAAAIVVGSLGIETTRAADPPLSMLSSQPYRLPQPARPFNSLPAPLPHESPHRTTNSESESLEQVWAIAVAQSERLCADTAEFHAARSSVSAAQAERMPTATFKGQYLLRDNEPAFRINTPSLPYAFESPYLQDSEYSFEGRVALPVYTGGTISNNIAASTAELRASECQIETHRQHLRMQVATEFVEVLRAQYGVIVAESHASSLASHARDIQMLYHCERAPKNDLLAAQVALSTSEYEVIRAKNAMDAACAALNRRLGRPFDAPLSLIPPNFAPPSDRLEDLTNRAIVTRPELSQLDAQLTALNCRAEATIGQNRAQVHIQGAYSFQENEFQSPEGITSAGIGVSWRPFDAGRVKHQANAKAQKARAVAHLRADLESRIQLEVRIAWQNAHESRRQIQVMRDAVGRAEENYRVTRERYQNGMNTNTDVLNAEALRVDAHHKHNSANLDSVLTALKLRRAIGAL